MLGQPTISAQQARAIVPFSIELGQDWDGLQNELVNLITDARSVLDATKFLTGSGTNEPFGVLTGLTVEGPVSELILDPNLVHDHRSAVGAFGRAVGRSPQTCPVVVR